MGLPLRRREDARLLAGHGCFVDDLAPAGCLYAAVVRSQHASARLLGIDATAACRLDGVALVLTAADLPPSARVLPTQMAIDEGLRKRIRGFVRDERIPVLPADRLVYVGQPVAFVVATSRAAAEDAAALVEVEVEPLPAVASREAALEPGAPLVHPAWGDNLFVHFAVSTGDVDGALARAPVVLRERFVFHRQASVALETRGLLAEPEPRGAGLRVWSTTQVPYQQRHSLAVCLGLPEESIRVTAPDVGGGFGPKGLVYPEDVLTALAALRLGRPVKYLADRREDLAATAQGRGATQHVTIAADRDGRVLALDARMVLEGGAYNPWQWNQGFNTVAHLPGPYQVQNLRADVTYAATNRAPCISIRGAGRPEAAFLIERSLDRVAAHLGLDPVEVRRRNLLPTPSYPRLTGLPYKDGQPISMDGGDFVAALDAALGAVGYADFRGRQGAACRAGRRIGLGVAAYVEGTGQGPFESARVRVDPSGTVICDAGASPQGQGHETTLAQVVASQLDVDPAVVRVRVGDTAHLPYGVGTYASRSAVTAGNAAATAAVQVRERAIDLAARALEVSPEDLVWRDGRASVRGAPGRGLGLAELAALAAPQRLAVDEPPSLEATAYFRPPTVTFSGGIHAAVVEVDPATGAVRVLSYAVAHDCGRVINPLLVEGQVMGGVAHGIGAALLEEVIVDDFGQPGNASLADYPLPGATDVPEMAVLHLESPSQRNPLGVKGIGEGGTICPPAAIASAIEDALRPLPLALSEVPISRERLWRAIQAATTGSP